MHTQTIIYNLENNIHYTADGANQESSFTLPAQMIGVIKLLKKFYRKFGINYDNPIYTEGRTDWKLYKLGITNKKNKKFPDEYIFHETGPSCYNGSIHNIFIRFYYLQYYGKDMHKKNSIRYFKDKISVANAWIEDYFKKKGEDLDLIIKNRKLNNGEI